jgi:hypothetical protein
MTALIMLMAKQPWLIDRAKALDYLQTECSSDAELDLTFELLDRFDYLNSNDLSQGFRSMVEQISNEWKLAPENTIICPPKVDSSADSGPAVVQSLKTIFGQQKIRGIELVITINKLRDYAKHRNIVVVVDDFAGTGKTVSDKLKNIRELHAYKEKPPKIYVCLLAAAEMARQAIEPHVDGYFVWREYQRGISDHYTEPALSAARKTMQEIEGRFSPIVPGEKLPCFGYGGTEVLMGWDSNLPNSVFPVFWWPDSLVHDSATKTERETLFSRYF